MTYNTILIIVYCIKCFENLNLTTVSEPCVHLFAAFDQGIQVSYSKETETVTLAFPEELKVTLKFLQYHTRGNFLSLFE